MLLIGGWTRAARLQPGGFDPVVDTISDLAAYGAADRWVMTLALLGVGACHVTSALALAPAALPGRALLAVGGVATVLVAASPLPAAGGGSTPHTLAAATALTALAAWPAAAWKRAPAAPGVLRPVSSALAAVVLLGTLGWFAAELATGGSRVGLSERVAAGAQALWPFVVVLGSRR